MTDITPDDVTDISECTDKVMDAIKDYELGVSFSSLGTSMYKIASEKGISKATFAILLLDLIRAYGGSDDDFQMLEIDI